MTESSPIAAGEKVPGRDFSDAHHSAGDAAILTRMLERLRRRALSFDPAAGPVEIREEAADATLDWIVVPDPVRLAEASDVSAVGFFGEQRPGMDHDVLYDLETAIVGRLGLYADAGLLAYYDCGLAPGVHGNLVLFAGDDVPAGWADDATHRRAVAVAPHHYTSVRLHRGRVRGALLGDGELTLERTRYFDFRTEPVWVGIRRLS